jgi:hypothetical protein
MATTVRTLDPRALLAVTGGLDRTQSSVLEFVGVTAAGGLAGSALAHSRNREGVGPLEGEHGVPHRSRWEFAKRGAALFAITDEALQWWRR